VRALPLLFPLALAAVAVADPPSPQGSPIELAAGVSRELVVPGASGAEVADAKVASVELFPGGTLKVKALAPGRTAVAIQVGKERRSFLLSVTGKVQRVELKPGQQKTLLVPDTARVQVLDATVAEAHLVGDNQVVLDGRGHGTTLLDVWGSAGQKATFELSVGAEEAGTNTLHVEVGGIAVLNVKSLTKLTVNDASVATASTLGPDIVQIQGVSEGTTVVNAWDARGKVSAYRVSVSP
jgi:Flp pilus assembly secretin CpaC